jgi:hypothetical protein
MSSPPKDPEKDETAVAKANVSGLVARSEVPPDKPYREYRRWLRHDFICSCAYCSMMEGEAMAIRFTIDHYLPKGARPDLIDTYDNLMYCCDECNLRKGDRNPPEAAQAAGLRFFRPDKDLWEDHFDRTGVLLKSKTATGDFSIQALDLNRNGLRRLREIRGRLVEIDGYVSSGVLSLKRFPIDRLPQHIKAKADKYIKEIVKTTEQLANAVDFILEQHARSPLVEDDADPDLKARTKQRLESLKKNEALYPGSWRARRKSRN